MKDFNQINKILKELIGYEIALDDAAAFIDMMNTVNTVWFNPILLEKDFWLTVILIYIANELPELRFKWWTCLNKIYYPYYRLSEDLDFTFPFNEEIVDSNNKRIAFSRKIREKIKKIVNLTWREINPDSVQHKKALWLKDLRNKEHTYLKYVLRYPSFIDWTMQTIKIELTYTPKQYFESKYETIKSIFINPINEKPLFKEQRIQCLSIEEMVTEKCRAALTRRTPAIRDFFDLWYLQNNWIDIFANKDVIIKKCLEITDLQRTSFWNYDELENQIDTELNPVLQKENNFDLKKIYNEIVALKDDIASAFKN